MHGVHECNQPESHGVNMAYPCLVAHGVTCHLCIVREGVSCCVQGISFPQLTPASCAWGIDVVRPPKSMCLSCHNQGDVDNTSKEAHHIVGPCTQAMAPTLTACPCTIAQHAWCLAPCYKKTTWTHTRLVLASCSMHQGLSNATSHAQPGAVGPSLPAPPTCLPVHVHVRAHTPHKMTMVLENAC